ncbi:MAG: Rrf2 family transcriptional regulator [Cytophagales bacterium]|nr:Rrf2 family transcriptional regulator [Cytophagales bacterium]
MLSKKAKYALKALVYLTKQNEKGLTLIAEIAEKEMIPKKFLEQILNDLRNHGILQSKRGKDGGYSLLKKPKDISVGQIVRIIDGPLAPIPCVSKLAYRKCDECKDEDQCEIRWVMKKVRDSTAEILDNTSLKDFQKLGFDAE